MPLSEEACSKLLHVLEQLYAERGAYRAIAMSVPNWQETFDFLMAEDSYRQDVAEAIADVSRKLKTDQQFLESLKRLEKGQIH
jgi:hypothetical protein